jgi:hypothetical protein
MDFNLSKIAATSKFYEERDTDEEPYNKWEYKEDLYRDDA